MSRLPGLLPPPTNVPTGNVDAPFYTAGDVAGDVETLYANAGTITEAPPTLARRQLANENPWAGGSPANLRKLTHFRAPGMGDAMWSGQCTYDLAGASPGFSYYDDPDSLAKDDGLTYSVTGGVVKAGDQLDVQEPTMNRRSRVAAHRDSAPAAAFFQGYFNPRWSGLLSGFRPVIQPRPLHSNFNPTAMGATELHRATEYKPVPPMGSIVGYFGTEKAI